MSKENTNQSTIIETHKNVESRRVLQVRVERDAVHGLRITIQSFLDWSQFARSKDSFMKIGGVDCYTPKQERINIGQGGYFSTNPSDWSLDDFPNLSMLLAKDIQNGATFNFGLIAVSDERLKEWLINLKTQVKVLYLTYIKPFDVEVDITSETVERERHQ